MSTESEAFDEYKRRFVQAARCSLAQRASKRALSESAFPAYAHANRAASWLFWSRIRQALRFVERHAPYRRALDFGCGGGVMLPWLARHSHEVIAYDVDLSGLEAMSQHIELPGNVRVSNILPADNGRTAAPFDLILALDVLEHVEDLAETLDQMASWLRPEGWLLVCGPTENLVYRIGRRLAGSEFTGHYHARTVYQVRSAMQSRFDVETISTLLYPIPLFKLYSGKARLAKNTA